MSSLPDDARFGVLKRFFDVAGYDAKQLWEDSLEVEDDEERLRYLVAAVKLFKSLRGYADARYIVPPVSVREFVEGRYLMNKPDVLYPAVLDAMQEINNGSYVECVLTGGIGTGKTSLALYTQAYQLYLLSCMKNPHREFGLDSSSEIAVIFQSLSASLAKGVDYMRFKDMVDNAPYFNEVFPYDKGIASEMRFPNRIVVKPVHGGATGAIGQNVIGGVIDELNFMAVVEGSRSAVGHELYDQAVENYNSIARRRESRFMSGGQLPGMLCLVSSKRYPGQFTDLKVEEARENAKIYVYDKTLWDIKPWVFSGDTFPIFIGDATRKPRILTEEESSAYEGAVVQRIPVEYTSQFEADIMNSLRDIAGVSTLAIHPFIMEADKVSEGFECRNSVFSREDVDFDQTQLQILTGNVKDKDEPRFVHIDLAVTSDSCGLVIGYVSGFTDIDRGEVKERLPVIEIDGVLEIRPPAGGEIEFEKVRRVLYRLREVGVGIRWVTMDTYQSRDSLQILAQQGFSVGTQSVDVTTTPYDVLKAALMDGRVRLPPHERCVSELLRLERNQKTAKIDHPPNGSKDCADALAGVVYGLTMRRETWVRHGVSVTMIPEWLTRQSQVVKNTLEGAV